MPLLPQAQYAKVGQVRAVRQLVVVKQFVSGFFFDGGFHAVGRPQGVKQLPVLDRIEGIAGNLQRRLRLPRQRRPFRCEPQNIIAGDGLALVGNAHEVAAIRSGRDGQGARDAKFDVLVAGWRGNNIRQDGHIDGAFRKCAPNRVGQLRRDALPSWGQVLLVFDADQQTAAYRVREGDTVLGQLTPIGRISDH